MLSASLIQLEYVPKQWKSTFSYSSKGMTLGQSLIGTQGEFLCNTNTCALHSKVILTHAMSWPKSYNANSTLLTMIHYTSAHVWKRKAYNASSITSGVL